MAVTIRLTNKSQVTKELSEIATQPDNELLFGRELYQTLGSLLKNKDVATRDVDTGAVTINWEKVTEEFASFAEDVNNLWLHTYYPELAIANNIPTPTPQIILVDEYLGNLGVSQEYNYIKDFINVTPWLDITKQSEYRVLIDEDDNTYLTDSNGDEILISYT